MNTSTPPNFTPFFRKFGFLRHIGPLWHKPEGRGVVVGLRVGEVHVNPMHTLHGGMMATLCDVAMAENAAYYAGADQFFVTIGLDAQFIAPAREGAWVEARATPTRITKSTAFMSARLTEGETVLMVANGIFRAPGKMSPEDIARLREGRDEAP
ncbi:MAG: PaaI family thioesterase [Alphaproteobacteria bacterium]